jgi:beta-glucosidase/6-phospho-beta-glucosidase/beta-galactosidase
MTERARLFVTLEGYAVEGGFDRGGEPMTCYSPTIALGRHPGPGAADNLWRDYERVLDLVPGLGFDGVRLTVEWARLEPCDGIIDDAAVHRYQEVVRHARSLGLLVTIAIVDGVWPSWLGQEAWLLPWVVPHVLDHARRMVTTFADDASGFIVFAKPKELVTRGFLVGAAPPWRKSALKDASFANAQIDRIAATLANDDVVGPRLVGRSAAVSLDAAPEDLVNARQASDVDELYVRSLLRGSGPTSVSVGLLAYRDGEWRVSASEESLGALR